MGDPVVDLQAPAIDPQPSADPAQASAAEAQIVAQRKALLKLWLLLTTNTAVFNGINIRPRDSEDTITANAQTLQTNLGDIPDLPPSAFQLMRSAVSPGFNDSFVDLQDRYQDVSKTQDFWPVQQDPSDEDHPTKTELHDFFTT